jgi:hypothetical protein
VALDHGEIVVNLGVFLGSSFSNERSSIMLLGVGEHLLLKL